MDFYLKRFGIALRTHQRWALLVLLALSLYLIGAALRDVTYTLSREVQPYTANLPVAASTSPVDTLTMDVLLADPDLLFLDGFAMTQLQKELRLQPTSDALADEHALRRLVHSSLSLSAIGDSSLRVSYRGNDATLGRVLVEFYTERLLKRVADGVMRTQSRLAPTARPLLPAGTIQVITEHSPWAANRLRPTIAVLLISSLSVLILIGLFELNDPSFKSERHIARYLALPVLGAIPDAGPLLRTLPDLPDCGSTD
ncbi:hypothetical protein [uncultured Lamprocystis sp.]|jgi:hypothetical protein|uniref:hypothetical protein n=1 Tax=uncultured Lamprocystis sp. TaxID=543132 RepID=UPI0025D32781|nr:hypothetical protein [uncultured Lamprocystis sp.]